MAEQMRDDIYRDFHGKIYAYIQSKVKDRFLAEDLTADVFLKVYERLGSFDERKSSLSTWIYTIARNTLTDYYRTRRVIGEIPETFAVSGSIEDDVCNSEMLDILADALEKLDERSRDIIIYRYYSGMTLKAIAETLNISYAYVKVLHNKALSEMKKFF